MSQSCQISPFHPENLLFSFLPLPSPCCTLPPLIISLTISPIPPHILWLAPGHKFHLPSHISSPHLPDEKQVIHPLLTPAYPPHHLHQHPGRGGVSSGNRSYRKKVSKNLGSSEHLDNGSQSAVPPVANAGSMMSRARNAWVASSLFRLDGHTKTPQMRDTRWHCARCDEARLKAGRELFSFSSKLYTKFIQYLPFSK
jgi:hypothetical protein